MDNFTAIEQEVLEILAPLYNEVELYNWLLVNRVEL